MNLGCTKNLSSLQRRSLRQLSAAISFTVAVNLFGRHEFQHTHAAAWTLALVAGLSVLPVVFAIWVIGRYLGAEQDEFIRALAVRALLWGLAVTMAGDAVAGALMEYYSRLFPLALLNADLFFASTGLTFRLLQWSYQ